MRSACRCRSGLPESLLAPSRDAALDLARRYARTHGRSRPRSSRRATALGRSTAEALLKTLAAAGRLLEGEFRPGGTGREWCDADVLQTIRRRSLAQAAEGSRAGRAAGAGAAGDVVAGSRAPRAPGSTRCSTSIENLQGAPLPASILESEILSARDRGLRARRSRRARRGGRGRLARRRAGRRTRRPRRDLPDRSLSRACGGRRSAGGALASASRRSSRTCSDTARRSSRRSTRPRAAAIPASRSTRCGTWCGRAC